MITNAEILERLNKGLSYAEYMDRMEIKILTSNIAAMDKDTEYFFEYTKLNLQRSLRIDKSYTVPEELKRIIKSIKDDQFWLVLTEDWCGDSAQILPFLSHYAKLNQHIKMKILLRDQNPDIMDRYLTNGTRGIPKLISYSKDGTELFAWGPRPREAQELVNKLKAEGMPKNDMYQQLHIWYSQNKGIAVEQEFSVLLKTAFNL